MSNFGGHRPGESEASLNVAAWHLQVLLNALTGFDGKIMFLTALNVAGISALVGIEATASPSIWLFAAGVTLSGACVAVGLARLWSADFQQFPSPDEALRIARETSTQDEELVRAFFFAIRQSAWEAEEALLRRALVFRALLVITPIALAIDVLTAVSVI